MNTAAMAADLLVILHLAFILFVMLGGVLLFRWPWVAWLHLPAVAWGALIELVGWICPLTPLEQRLRASAGEAGYTGGFAEQYLLPLIYPDGLTREIQLALGLLVLIFNAVIYGWWWRRRHAAKR
jgi:hypothetical protein